MGNIKLGNHTASEKAPHQCDNEESILFNLNSNFLEFNGYNLLRVFHEGCSPKRVNDSYAVLFDGNPNNYFQINSLYLSGYPSCAFNILINLFLVNMHVSGSICDNFYKLHIFSSLALIILSFTVILF
jgi:hypothetical protein